MTAVRAALAKAYESSEPDLTRNTASVARVVSTALAHLADSASREVVREALRRRDLGRVLRELDWVGFTDEMQASAEYVRYSLAAYGRREIRETSAGRIAKATDPLVAEVQVVLTAVDVLAIRYSQRAAARLIASVTEDVRESVRTLVTSSLYGELTVDQLARRLVQFIPLLPRDVDVIERAYSRDWLKAIKDGKTVDQATQIAEQLRERLVKRKTSARAQTIARTELIAASNEGRYAGWEAAADGGLIDPRSVKEWIASPSGACPECQALDGMLAPWDGRFPNGMTMPPDHPRCRCSFVLLPPDDEIIAQMEEQFTDRPEDAETIRQEVQQRGNRTPRNAADAPSPTGPPSRPRRRRLNAGDLTSEQGQQIAEWANQAGRGELSMPEYRARVRALTSTDSRGRPVA